MKKNELKELLKDDLLKEAEKLHDQVSDLEAEYENLRSQADRAATDAKIAALEQQLQVAEAEKAEAVAALNEEKKKLGEELEQAMQLAEDANKQLSLVEVSKKTGNRPTVEHDGKTYHFALNRFQHNGKVVEAKKAVEDSALIAELIEKGSGVLVCYEEKEGGKS